MVDLIIDKKYYNTLDIEGFSKMMNSPSYCYKFYWLEAIVQLISANKTEATYDEIINKMISNAWYPVLEYHIHLSGIYGEGAIKDNLEKAVLRLQELSQLANNASDVEIINKLQEFSRDRELRNYKTELASSRKNLLKRLMEQMILEGYLVVGNYQVIKLGDISALKKPETRVSVKITDEDKRSERAAKSKRKVAGMESLTSAGFKLFDKFRELRLEIAREERMPPYIIFSDKTLIDMAVKVPMTKQEMLNVSGVGENKFAKYGERFLSVLEECTETYPELIENKAPLEEEKEVKVTKKAKKKTGKQEFSLLQEEASNFQYADYMYISDIRNEMNRICERKNVKKLPATRLIEVLVSEEFIIEQELDGRFVKVPTEKGFAIGIKEVEKVSVKGYTYTLLVYPVCVQKRLVEHYIREINKEEEMALEVDESS